MADSAHILPMRWPMGMVPATPIWRLGKHGLRLPLRLHVDDENMTDPKPRRPIETKLFAGVGGVAIGKPISDVILWSLGVIFWNAPNSGPDSDVAGGFVPLPWRGLIEWLVPVILGAVAYYWAPHTHRPDLIDETLPVIKPVAIDDQVTAQLDKIDATINKLEADLHHDHGLSILGDPAHD